MSDLKNITENQSVINNLSHDGRGVVSVNGKKVLIDGVLPGETVSWVYTKRHRRFDEAKVDKVVISDPGRAMPICPSFLVCGGCSYQHMDTDKQLEYKQSIVAELLEHIGGKVKVKNWLEPLRADNEGYRTKARLGIRYVCKKEKLLIGFREKSSNFITDMSICKVLHPKLDSLLGPLNNLISSLEIYQQIPQVEFAMGDEVCDNNIVGQNVAVIIRNLVDFSEADNDKLLAFAEQHNINLLIQPKGPDSLVVIHGNKELFYEYKSGDVELKYIFHPQDFTQVNLKINKLMLEQAMRLLDLNGDEKVLDLFCGLGNFTLPFAKKLSSNGGSIVGIEGCDKMVARAYGNCKLNNITNAEFYCLDLYSENNELKGNALVNTSYDCVILDPPRSGAKQVIDVLAKNKIKKILYVSCDPATFARDVGILCNEHGYKLQHVGIMDMFPHTKHVETMGLLTKSS